MYCEKAVTAIIITNISGKLIKFDRNGAPITISISSNKQIRVLENKMLFLKERYSSLNVYSPVPIDELIPIPIRQVIIITHELKSEYIPNCSGPRRRVNNGVVIKAIPCSKKVLIIFKNVVLLTVVLICFLSFILNPPQYYYIFPRNSKLNILFFLIIYLEIIIGHIKDNTKVITAIINAGILK